MNRHQRQREPVSKRIRTNRVNSRKQLRMNRKLKKLQEKWNG